PGGRGPVTEVAVGIDCGTSGMRLVAIDADGRTAFMAARAYGGAPGDPASWAGGLEDLLDALNAEQMSVRRIAIDGTSGTLLACDEAGEAIGQAILYDEPCEDTALLAAIDAAAPPTSVARGASSGLARAIRLAARPGAARILHQADWLAGRLTGRFDQSDENNALKTGYDPVSRTWPAWMEGVGAPLGRLPSVHPVGTDLGPVQGSWTSRYPCLQGATVAAGTTDGCAAFLASGASEVGEAVTSLGSTLVLKVLADRPIFEPRYGLYSHRIGDRWLAGGASNTGGAVLAEHFTVADMEALGPRLRPDVPTGHDAYPLRRPGERFPINDPNLAPRFPPREDDAIFLQALFEGMAAIEARGYALIESLGGPRLASVRTAGGGAASAAWTEIRRRALNVPFPETVSGDAAYGTARLAQGAVP
ncbi:MAG: carbohydrate kinase, partial [Pseudomonadota bacterium]